MRLYHYTSFAGALGILESKSMWASSIHFLNDKEEFKHGITLAAGIADSLLHMQSDKGKWLLKGIIDFLPVVQEGFVYVVSFAEDGNLLSQWRGYTGAGGVSMGFDQAALKAAASRFEFRLLRCVYDDAEKVRLLTEYLQLYLGTVENARDAGEVSLIATEWVLRYYAYAASFKHKSFGEENEWRLISNVVQIGHPRVKVRPGRSLPIPYFDLPLQQASSNSTTDIGLRSIIIGPHHEQELAKRAMLIATATQNVGVESIVNSEIPYRSI